MLTSPLHPPLSDPTLPLDPALAEQLPEGIAVYRPDGTCLYVNAACEAQYGTPRTQVVGRSLWEFPGVAGSPFDAAFRKTLETGQLQELDSHYAGTGRTYATRLVASGGCVVVSARDVTDERRAQEAVRLHTRILERMAEGVLLCDDAGVIQYANPAADRMFGYARGALVGRQAAELNDYPPEENAERVTAILTQLRLQGEWEGEFRNVAADGRRFVTRSRLTALELGGRSCFVSVQQDVTERQRQEALAGRLHQVVSRLGRTLSEDEIAAAVLDEALLGLGASHVGLWLLSADGSTLEPVRSSGHPEASASLRRIPLAGDAPIAHAVREGAPLWLQGWAEYARRFPESAARSAHLQCLGRDPAIANLPLRVEGRTVGALCIVLGSLGDAGKPERWFTEMLAEHCAQALDRARLFAREAATRARLEAVFLASPAPIMLLEQDGTVRLWNPAAERTFGWRSDEVLGQPLPAVPYARRGELAANLARVARGECFMGEEARRLTRSGETLDVALYAAPVYQAQGPTQCLAIVVDVSQAKRDEAERAALLREAQAAVRIREDFLGVASHELKTPLTPLSLKLQSLARDLDAQPDSDFTRRARASVATGRKQVQKLSELIGDLLDVARIMGGRFALNLEELELGALVREVAVRHEALAERSGSPLHLTVPETPVHGRWDRLRLEQVATNLVDNALKYGAGRPVHVTLVQEGGRAVITVRDEGIGIPAGDLHRIFERFERAVSERHYGGLGLGLYITRTIVEGLGGHIGVVSAPGAGATFRVELPLQPSSPPA